MMVYQNPVIGGFYPDPSVCAAHGKYYLVCSSMQYFPGVPLFESDDLLNWTQIGHCLTKSSQVQLADVASSGGVFAPTIRFYKDRFYMVTTNDSLHRHFYVWTDDIYGTWSEPIDVEQSGIDPSLYFENDRCWFVSNGEDDDGVPGVVMCEIDIATGRKLSPSHTIWQGTGGRYLEAPHIYQINGEYYLLAAEGGTEYGHMATYARSRQIDTGYVTATNMPLLTNRNLGGYEVQGVGHGDLVQDARGNWWMLHLAFRQIDRWLTYHHLGREVFLTPVDIDSSGWLTSGENGTARLRVATDRLQATQARKCTDTFANTCWAKDWCYIRHPDMQNYQLSDTSAVLTGTSVTLDDVGSPTWIGLRQRDFNAVIRCNVEVQGEEGGLTLYMDELHHYEIALRKEADGFEAIARLSIGEAKTVQQRFYLGKVNQATLVVHASRLQYRFAVIIDNREVFLGNSHTKYLSSEVAGGFTGVMIGLYAVNGHAIFREFECRYRQEPDDCQP